MNFAELSPEERLIAEQVVLNLRTLNSAADAAVDGTVAHGKMVTWRASMASFVMNYSMVSCS
ncbi:MAG: hypothetical protein ABGZ53_00980 [Fuerstiella sp.]